MTARLCRVLLALVGEKVDRLTRYLNESTLTCTDAENQLIHFLMPLVEHLGQDKLDTAYRLLSLPDVRDYELIQVSDLLVTASSDIDIIMAETEVFPRRRPPAEIYDLLESAFPWVVSSEYGCCVVLWPIYNFGADPDLAERLQRNLSTTPANMQQQVVLFLAELEKDNPPMWAILGHEMGHAIEESMAILDSMTRTDGYGMSRQWMAELVADIIGIRVFGPAYFCAFAFLTLTDDNPGRYSDTHPSLSKRLQLLYEELKEMGVLDGETKEAVDGYYQMVTERVPIGGDSADTDFQWDDIFSKCREAVLEKSDQLRMYTATDRQQSEYLAKLLHSGIPIGSSLDESVNKNINKDTNKLLSDLSALPRLYNQDLSPLKERFEKVIDSFIEQPSHPVCVLNAGWLFRWTSLSEYCASSEGANYWFNIIIAKDIILKKSIESIPIHQSLQGLLNAS